MPGEENNASSADEKQKKVLYFKELEKFLGLIEDFFDIVEEKIQEVSKTDIFIQKNLDYISQNLQELKEMTRETMVKGISRMAYTDVVRVFFHIQNSIQQLEKLYKFTLAQITTKRN